MAPKRFKPTRRAPSLKPKRRDVRYLLLFAPLLVLAGALLDPSLIEPVGPFADQPERVSATFDYCGPGGSAACVIDGDTFRLGDRTIRIVGIDAPEFGRAECLEEAALARRSRARLLALLNQGPFEMIAHRLQRHDRLGRNLMAVRRGKTSIGGQLRGEGLAHRYFGSKRSWC